MRRALLLCLLLCPLGAGCATAPTDPREAACRRRALDDPTVQAAIERANTPLQEVRVPGVREQQRTIDSYVRRCLGGPNVGGVEPVRRQ